MLHGPLASHDDPTHWATFDEAASFAWKKGWNIGYVIVAGDGVCCVDLDVRDAVDYPDKPEKWTSAEEIAQHRQRIEQLDSYTELSIGGKSWHVWVKAEIGQGASYGDVQIYSQKRFIICTGNVVRDKPMEERQELIDVAVAQIRQLQGPTFDKVPLVEVSTTYTDSEIWGRAIKAENGPKFIELCGGDWPAQGYKSQSEADLALLSIIAFYTPSNEQVRRLFRMTKLGQREKAVVNDVYIDRTLSKIRSRQESSQKIDISVLEKQAELRLSLLAAAAAAAAAAAPPTPALPRIVPQVANATADPAIAKLPPLKYEGKLENPPGFVGDMSQFIFDHAPRPFREAGIVGALGIMAGICGLAWHLPQSGLNQYVILIAKSAVGKESMHTGISSIVGNIGTPKFNRFFNFNAYASGPALQKAVARERCFVSINSEWGHTMERLSQADRNPAMQTLRTVMTQLYQKSGPRSIVGGIEYSKKDENIASVNGVSFSMIGETTPAQYFQSLTQEMMADGFLSRFTMIEYTGDRVPLNNCEPGVPPAAMVSKLHGMATFADQVSSSSNELGRVESRRVGRDAQAGSILAQYDAYCDEQINKIPEDEAWRQMWNRAHLKTMRIAALLAVGDNHDNAVMRLHNVEWALSVVNRDIALMQQKMAHGDIGSGDDTRERKLLAICKAYITNPIPASQKIPVEMRDAYVVPRSYLQNRTGNVANFSKHALGATRALDLTLKSLCDSGKLKELDPKAAIDKWGSHGKLYAIIDLN